VIISLCSHGARTHGAARTGVSDVTDARGGMARIPARVHVAATRRCILQIQVVDRLARAVAVALAGGYNEGQPISYGVECDDRAIMCMYVPLSQAKPSKPSKHLQTPFVVAVVAVTVVVDEDRSSHPVDDNYVPSDSRRDRYWNTLYRYGQYQQIAPY